MSGFVTWKEPVDFFTSTPLEKSCKKGWGKLPQANHHWLLGRGTVGPKSKLSIILRYTDRLHYHLDKSKVLPLVYVYNNSLKYFDLIPFESMFVVC